MTLVDLHDAALYTWRDAGARGDVLVHVDAHHDADAEEWDFITISNFVWWALREGVVRDVFWVVPDASWNTRQSRAAIRQSIERLVGQHHDASFVQERERSVHATIAGRSFTACALSSLPAVRGALLDIDVDYLLVPDIARESSALDHAFPWIWPPALVAALRATGVSPSMVTVATSVRGGFTPIEWKYLGEELCAVLSGERLDGYEALRAGAEAELRSDLAAARIAYREAMHHLPASPGVRYRLARLALRLGNAEAARTLFQEAAALDPSYRAGVSEGRRWQNSGNVAAERRVYAAALRMDPDNALAELGLARIEAARGRDTQAIEHFHRALARDDTLVDGHRGIGACLERSGDFEGAIRHYRRSLRLELLGRPTLDTPIATRPKQLFDAIHWDIHRRLAQLERDRKWEDAVGRLCRSHL